MNVIQEHINQLLSFMKEEAYKPLTVQELEEACGIKDSTDFKDFVKALVAMEEQGLVVRTRSNRYGLPEKMNLIRGKVIGHPKGFAFVQISEKEKEKQDIFIPPSELKNAMHGDIVLVRVQPKSTGTREEGEVVRIIERGVKEIVGTYEESRSFGFVTVKIYSFLKMPLKVPLMDIK